MESNTSGLLESAKGEGYSQNLSKSSYPKNITLVVLDPLVKEETFTKHVMYKIKGFDNSGEIEIYRRYSDFNALRAALVERWPACYIPPLPGKKLIGGMDPTFIEERRHYLQVFLESCIDLPHLYQGEEVQTFLRNKAPDVSATLNNLPKLSYEDLIEKYVRVYSFLSGIELNNESVAKITDFQTYLIKVSKMFENFKKIAKAMVNAKKSYYDNFVNFHQMLLVDYEKTCLTEYSSNKDAVFLFNDPSSDKLFLRVSKITEASLKDSYEILNNLIRHESKEIKAFLQAIEQREKYNQMKEKLLEKIKSDTKQIQKISEGKTTLKGLFTTKSKDQQVADTEKHISESKNSIDKLGMLHDMMTLIISNAEIARFKEKKVEKYLQVIKLLSNIEQGIAEEMNGFWSAVSQSDILKQIP